MERVREEWFKWARLSAEPSAGLRFLIDTEWVEHFPEIKVLAGTPQDAEWHPEGDVFTHTCHCCDAMSRLEEWRRADAESRIVYMLAIPSPRFREAATTRREVKGENANELFLRDTRKSWVAPTEKFLDRIDTPGAIRDRVVPLVRNHLFHIQEISDRAVRRLARRLAPENIEGLCVVMMADAMGRPPRPTVVPENVTRLLARAHELDDKSKRPASDFAGASFNRKWANARGGVWRCS